MRLTLRHKLASVLRIVLFGKGKGKKIEEKRGKKESSKRKNDTKSNTTERLMI